MTRKMIFEFLFREPEDAVISIGCNAIKTYRILTGQKRNERFQTVFVSSKSDTIDLFNRIP